MKIKVNIASLILAYDGTPFKQNGIELTYRDAISIAINSFNDNERPTAEQKSKSFQISLKIFAKDEVEFTEDDVVYIKQRAEIVVISPLVFGRLKELFDKPVEPEVPSTPPA